MLDNLKKFNEWHEKHPGHFQDLKAEPWLAQWHEDALALSGPVAGLDVLEVGCGLGDFSIYLSKQGANIIGTDFYTKELTITYISNNKFSYRISSDGCDFKGQFLIINNKGISANKSCGEIIFDFTKIINWIKTKKSNSYSLDC